MVSMVNHSNHHGNHGNHHSNHHGNHDSNQGNHGNHHCNHGNHHCLVSSQTNAGNLKPYTPIPSLKTMFSLFALKMKNTGTFLFPKCYLQQFLGLKMGRGY